MTSPAAMFAAARLVLFDAVGTLIYPEPSVADVYWSLAQEFGSQLRKEQIQSRFRAALAQGNLAETNDAAEHNRWRQIVAHVLNDVTPIDPLFERLWAHFARGHHWRLYSDVAENWPALVGATRMVGVASNFDRRLEQVMAELSLPGLTHVFSSAEVGYSKPDGRFFSAIEKITGFDPQDILLVGDDRMADAAGAAQAGWPFVLIERSSTAVDTPGEGASKYPKISSFSELLAPPELS